MLKGTESQAHSYKYLTSAGLEDGKLGRGHGICVTCQWHRWRTSCQAGHDPLTKLFPYQWLCVNPMVFSFPVFQHNPHRPSTALSENWFELRTLWFILLHHLALALVTSRGIAPMACTTIVKRFYLSGKQRNTKFVLLFPDECPEQTFVELALSLLA